MKKKLYEGWIDSGKTNSIKKRVKELISENKSMVILDTKREYEELFNNTNYEIIKFDLPKLNESIDYNPLNIAEKLYKKGLIDEAIDKITSFGDLLFEIAEGTDPFWDNSAKSMYTGICLYLLEQKRNLTLKEIIKVSIEEMNELTDYINKQDVLSTINIITSSIINAPTETKGGILSVLKQKLGYFANRPNLLDKICTTNNIEIKNTNQVIILTNFDQGTIFNILIENFLINITNEMIERNEDYTVILDNYDSIINKDKFTTLFKTYLSDKIECIVGVRDNSFVKPIDEFKIMYRKGEEV